MVSLLFAPGFLLFASVLQYFAPGGVVICIGIFPFASVLLLFLYRSTSTKAFCFDAASYAE